MLAMTADPTPMLEVDVKGYRNPPEFPYEAFVQAVLERHFVQLGYRILSFGHADLVCGRAGERWIVEAKGQTSDIGLDFRTGLGQIVITMKDETCNYAIAVPDISAFRRQADKVTAHVRRALNLHVIFVDQNGRVDID